jgi:hypothetical protein
MMWWQVWHWHDKVYLLWFLPRSLPCWCYCGGSQFWVQHRNPWGTASALVFLSLQIVLCLPVRFESCWELQEFVICLVLILASLNFFPSWKLVCVLLWSGIAVWQREVVGEWWSLGDRDSRELASWEHISLNMHFHLCGLEINTNQQSTICLLVGMDICCMDRLLWPE